MREERLQEIKDSVNFQREILLAHNMETLCVDEEQELIEVIERLNNIINEFERWMNNIPNYFMDRRSNNTGVYVQKSMQQMIDMCKNKLQELKGVDKE